MLHIPDAIDVKLDMHRWYAILTITRTDGTMEERCIGSQPSDGLGLYDSFDEYVSCVD